MAYSKKKHKLDVLVLQGIIEHDIELVKKCLKEGVSVKYNRACKCSLLKLAVLHNSLTIFELLIKAGANPLSLDDFKKLTESGNLLHIACEEARRIYEEIFKTGRTALLQFESDQNCGIIKHLIESGVNVNELSNLKETPLDMCAHPGSEAYPLLVSYGAQHNIYG